MKLSKKKLFLMSSAMTVTTVIVATAPSTASAEAKITSLVFDYQGSAQFTLSYEEYVDAIFSGSGDLYELVDSDEAQLSAIGVDDSDFVDYTKFANAIFDSPNKTAIEVLGEISTDSSYTVDADTVATYETIEGFNDDGAPIFGEAVTPEVISID